MRNKATVERALQAAQAIDDARSQGKELAKDTLQRLMELCEGASSVFQPVTPQQLAAGRAPNANEDWDRFGEWIDRTMWCAKELAKYQSPTFKAVIVTETGIPSAGPGSPPLLDQRKDGTVVQLNDPIAAARVYQRIASVGSGR